jgi:hypothetical protein
MAAPTPSFTAFAGDELHEPLSQVVTSLLQDEDAQAAAVSRLANLIDQAEGEAAEAVRHRATRERRTASARL